MGYFIFAEFMCTNSLMMLHLFKALVTESPYWPAPNWPVHSTGTKEKSSLLLITLR